ncbi:MAG: hypothetical protein AAGJ93_00815 [Bacteroidota bacterium]
MKKDIQDAEEDIAKTEQESQALRKSKEEQSVTVKELEMELRALEQMANQW